MEVKKSIFKLTGVVQSLGLHQYSLEVGVLHLQDGLRTSQCFLPLTLSYETPGPGNEDVRAVLVHAEGNVQVLQSWQGLLLVEKIQRLSRERSRLS